MPNKANKGLTAVEKNATKEKIISSFLSFAKVVKALTKSSVDLLSRFQDQFNELEGLVEKDAMDAIDAARALILSLGAPAPIELDSKLDGIMDSYISLQALSPRSLEYYKLLKRLKFDKLLNSYNTAAAKAQKKFGGG